MTLSGQCMSYTNLSALFCTIWSLLIWASELSARRTAGYSIKGLMRALYRYSLTLEGTDLNLYTLKN